MSFIVTTVSPETVVQVSDTRHSSLANQSPIDDDLRKTLVVRGRKTHFVLGWAGLATDVLRRHNTGEWLFKALFEMNAVELPIEDIALRLETLATAHFANLKALDKRCVFVMAGWQQSEPFLCTVSNYCAVLNSVSPDATGEIQTARRHHIPSVSEAATAASKFHGSIQRFRDITERDYVVNVMGDFKPDKLKTHFMGLESLLKKRARASEISGACRQIALQAAVHSNTVGTNLIGAEMSSTGHATCSFYSENGAETILVPAILSPEGCSTQGTISTCVSGDEFTVRLQAKIAKRVG